MTNLDNILKNRDTTLSTKVCLLKAMFFPVVMYGCESWTVKKAECWCFWTVVLEKTLETPLDCKGIQPVHPKGDQSWVFIGGTDVGNSMDRGAWWAIVYGVIGELDTTSVQFSCSVVSDSLQPHELQHSRPPCPSPTPGVHSVRFIIYSIHPLNFKNWSNIYIAKDLLNCIIQSNSIYLKFVEPSLLILKHFQYQIIPLSSSRCFSSFPPFIP